MTENGLYHFLVFRDVDIHYRQRQAAMFIKNFFDFLIFDL